MIDEVVILAAGKSTRMGGDENKVLKKLDDRPMIEYVLDTVLELGIMAPVVVVGYQADQVSDLVRGYNEVMSPIFVSQDNPAGGTGDAVATTRELLAGEFVAVLYGDMPFVRSETLYKLAEKVAASEAVMGMVTTKVDETSHFGRILRDQNSKVTGIVEWKNASEAERRINEGNLGVYVFRTNWLLAALPKLTPNSVTGEVYLTDLVNVAVTGKQVVIADMSSDHEEALGINTPEELQIAESAAKKKK